MDKSVILKTKNISKTFGATKALVDVNFEIGSGEIHGLIGENGSGKSTLSTIIAAVQKADANSGKIIMNGEVYKPDSVIEANTLGVAMIVQEQNTINGLSAASNIYCGRERLFSNMGFLDIKKMNQSALAILKELEIEDIDPKEFVEKMTFENRKIVELARTISIKPQLLIVDETTTALTVKGREILYKVMKKLRNNGGAVLFISHDIDEIEEMCDALTVLRDGRKIATLTKEEFDTNKIRQLMVGREISEHMYREDNTATCQKEVALEAKNLTLDLIKNVSLKVNKGEILGIGGLTDCGMHDLGKILFGLLKPDGGKVLTGKGVEIKNQIIAIENEIGYVSKNRDKESLMLAGSIMDNICSVSIKNLSTKAGLVSRNREREFSGKWADRLNVKMNSTSQYCSELSGGNKQKVVLAKWLGKNSEVFIFDCPTRGIDVGVKASIYKLMEELKSQGKAIIMISEELSELIGMSDRIMILKDGMVSGEFKRDEMITEKKLIHYMI